VVPSPFLESQYLIIVAWHFEQPAPDSASVSPSNGLPDACVLDNPGPCQAAFARARAPAGTRELDHADWCDARSTVPKGPTNANSMGKLVAIHARRSCLPLRPRWPSYALHLGDFLLHDLTHASLGDFLLHDLTHASLVQSTPVRFGGDCPDCQ
jgi:hypothetical protein